MRLSTLTISLMALSPLFAHAAGLDRSEQQVDALFEDGNYAEIYYAHVKPTIEGTDALKQEITDTAEDYNKIGGALKLETSDKRFSSAMLIDQPWGVNTTYDSGILKGTKADIGSIGVTGLVKYRTASNFSIFGGFGFEQIDGDVLVSTPVGEEKATSTVLQRQGLSAQDLQNLQTAAQGCAATPTVGACPTYLAQAQALTAGITGLALTPSVYSADFGKGNATTFVGGVAYEYPEIALRADLTYRSAAEHEANVTEAINVMTDPVTKVSAPTTRTVKFKFPQSVNLNFQTGIMADTLLMTKFRWVNWKEFDVAPLTFKGQTGESLASYEEDQFSGSIGVGRRFTDKFSGALSFEYDTGTGEPYTALGPYGDTKGVTLSGQYKINDMMDISAGVNYTKLGDAFVESDGQKIATFEGGSAIGVGTKLGFHF